MPRVSDFVEAICESPGDDTPRLIYADFLEENGDQDRAEFIRLQCERALLSPWDRRAKELRYREWLLLCKNCGRWYGEMPKIEGVTWGRFERGFVAEVKVLWLEDALSRQTEILHAAPINGVRTGPGVSRDQLRTRCDWLEKLWITDPAKCAVMQEEDFLTCEALENLKGLSIEGASPDSDAVCTGWFEQKAIPALKLIRLGISINDDSLCLYIALNGRLCNLEALSIGQVHNSPYRPIPGVLEAISQWPAWKGLKCLSVYDSTLAINLVNHVVGASKLTNLESLEIHKVDLCETLNETDSDECLLPQLQSLSLEGCMLKGEHSVRYLHKIIPTNIHSLNLGENPVGSAFWQSFQGKTWPKLHSLDFFGTQCTDERVQALADNNSLPDILDLNLGHNRLGPVKAIHALASAPWAERLRILNLSQNEIRAGYLLATSKKLQGLWWLRVGWNPLAEEGISGLCLGEWKELSILDVSHCFDGDVGFEHIVNSPFYEHLHILNVSCCRCGDASFKAMSRLPAKSLVQLIIYDNKVTDDGIFALAESQLPCLRGLVVRDCNVSSEAIRALYDSPLFRNLDLLDIWGARMPPELGPEFGKLSPFEVKPLWEVFHRFNHDPWN